MVVTDAVRLLVKMYDKYIGFEMTGGTTGKGVGATGWKGALLEVYCYATVFALAWFGAKHLDTTVLFAYLVSGGCCFLTALLVSYGVIQEFFLPDQAPPLTGAAADRRRFVEHGAQLILCCCL